jgi:hypothetical protein
MNILLELNGKVGRKYIIKHNIRKISLYKISNDKRVKEP